MSVDWNTNPDTPGARVKGLQLTAPPPFASNRLCSDNDCDRQLLSLKNRLN